MSKFLGKSTFFGGPWNAWGALQFLGESRRVKIWGLKNILGSNFWKIKHWGSTFYGGQHFCGFLIWFSNKFPNRFFSGFLNGFSKRFLNGFSKVFLTEIPKNILQNFTRILFKPKYMVTGHIVMLNSDELGAWELTWFSWRTDIWLDVIYLAN